MSQIRGIPATRWIIGLVLGRDASMQLAIQRTVMAMLVYLMCVLAVILNVLFGFSNPQLALALISYMLIGPTVFYLLVRSGWSRRTRDPALTIPQNLYALTALVLAYPVTGPMRALNLLLVALLPLFGFLAMSPRQTRLMALSSLTALGAMMASLAWFYPERFDPHIEAMSFALSAFCLPCVALLLGEASKMRFKVRAQRSELEAAKARLETVAARDYLTDLFNRRYIGGRLAEECQRHAMHRHTFCIALIDMDHFKQINDGFGHAVGDSVLCLFAKIAQSILPASCELGRWGGEEFLLLLPDRSAEEALGLIDAIRSRLADPARTPEVPAEMHLTFSAGLIDGSTHGSDEMLMLEFADRALYQAKADGRDRTVLMVPSTGQATRRRPGS